MSHPAREENLISARRHQASASGLDPDYVEDLFRTILRNSRVGQLATVSTHGVKPGARILIVGGLGSMGQFLGHWFTQSDYQVRVLDRDDWGNVQSLASDIDLCLLAVPIDITPVIAARITPHLSSECVLADITSLKADPVQAMLRSHVGPVIGLHPLYGPATKSMDRQIVVVNPGRDHERCHWLLEQLTVWGNVLVQTSPEEHDEIMGIFGCAKLVVFANIPEDNPFMAGAYLGDGEPEAVVNIGVSGPGVVCSALRRRQQLGDKVSLGDLAEEIKITSFSVTRVGELIGRDVARELGVAFGIVDLSLAPTPTVGDSVGDVIRALGIDNIGAPGSTAAVAMMNDAIKKGGAFASSSVGGMSGAFIPVSEDATLADAARQGHLCLEKLEAMTSVCSVGLDMIAIPGDTTTETISAIMADEMAIGVINNKRRCM